MRIRADVSLVNNGYFTSRERAQTAIMEGVVFADGRPIKKPSDMIDDTVILSVRDTSRSYVSRGAYKLIKAVSVFHADFKDKVIMDIGASTGGFTEVCLLNGAKMVYAIDVGYGQLDWKLRQDKRVIVMERTNARQLKPEQFIIRPAVTVMDVSFISVCLIIPAAIKIMGDSGVFYTLIKPQFEAGREKVGKKGVVRDPEVHFNVIEKISKYVAGIGWKMDGLDYSPITGPEGNIEFLARISCFSDKSDTGESIGKKDIEDVVAKAYQEFSK